MAVLSATAPAVPGDEATDAPAAPKTRQRPSLPPRSVPLGTPTFTRRELAALPRLDATFREMYTAGLPELDLGERLVVGVTSAVRGEGRTSTALGLALAAARDLDVRVLLVELDLEHPALASELGVAESPGLVDVLAERVELEDALRHLDTLSVDVLPVGQAPRAVSRLLRSAGLRDLLCTARSCYDVVVVDFPPALSTSDVVPLGALTDGVLLVVRSGITPAKLVQQAIARFGQGKVRGVVLTGQRSKIPTWLRRLL